MRTLDIKSGQEQVIPCAGGFEYIGLDPHTNFLKDLGIHEQHGYIVVNPSMEPPIPGIYGAGDCNVKDLRQVVTACSDGAIAAQNASHYLRKNGIVNEASARALFRAPFPHFSLYFSCQKML